MAVRLRLTRVGGKKDPIWRVVVADQRSPRDGRVIETIGHYNAQTDPSTIVIDEERARSWLARGAQPSDTVRKLLRIQGIERRGPAAAAPGRRRDGQREPAGAAEYLAEGLVDEPEAVAVEQFEEDDGTVVLELCVARGRLRQGDRPGRAHRPGAAHGRQGRGGRRGQPRARRHRRLTRQPGDLGPRADAPAGASGGLPAGRVGGRTGSTAASTSRGPRPRLLAHRAAR